MKTNTHEKYTKNKIKIMKNENKCFKKGKNIVKRS